MSATNCAEIVSPNPVPAVAPGSAAISLRKGVKNHPQLVLGNADSGITIK